MLFMEGGFSGLAGGVYILATSVCNAEDYRGGLGS